MAGAARRRTPARVAITLALSAAGGAAASLLGLPAAWLSGGLLFVAVASLAGVDTHMPKRLGIPVYLVLGIYSGSGVSPDTLQQIQTWPASFAVLGVSLVALVAGCYWWLHVRCGWDRDSALLAALPGALSFVLAAAESLKADMKKVAIAQSLRLILLVELIPLAALMIGAPSEAPATAAFQTVGWLDLLILLSTASVAAFVLERVGLPGGWMLGGLLASATLLLGGFVEGKLPPILVVPAMVALAAIAGSRFRPGDLAVLPRIAGPALVAFAISIGVSAVGAGLVSLLFGLNIIQTLLAFAPGALESLIILAYDLNIDPAYVAAHHVVRFLALVAAVPLIARRLNRSP